MDFLKVSRAKMQEAEFWKDCVVRKRRETIPFFLFNPLFYKNTHPIFGCMGPYHGRKRNYSMAKGGRRS